MPSWPTRVDELPPRLGKTRPIKQFPARSCQLDTRFASTIPVARAGRFIRQESRKEEEHSRTRLRRLYCQSQ
jgi:hypothetical protein